MKKILFASVILVLVGTLAWLSIPIRSGDVSVEDPIVSYLNTKHGRVIYRESYFDQVGPRLHTVSAGNGELVLLLHGFPSNWFSLNRIMERLKHDYHVVAIDGLGVGLSEAPSELSAYTLDAMSKQLIALADQYGAKSFHLIGHDWGAVFSFSMAQAYPHRIASVTGLSGVPLNSLLASIRDNNEVRETFTYIEKLKSANLLMILLAGGGNRVSSVYEELKDQGYISDKEGTLFKSSLNSPKRIDAHINWYRANIPQPEKITFQDFWPAPSARITNPALFIYGENDPIISSEIIKNIQSVADQLEIHSLPNVGHWPQFEASDVVTDRIKKFIASNSLNPQT